MAIHEPLALDQPIAEPDPRRYWALAVIAIAQLMIVLDASVVIVALPSAQRALHISVADRQWVMSAYTLAFGSLLLLGGRIADYLGRRRMFFVGLLGFAGASALGGLAQTSAMLFGARALQGAFAAVMAPAALSLLTVTFTEPHERARAFGVYGGIAGGGAAIGLVLGGALTQYASWRWTLLINVPIALVAAFAVTRVINESKGSSRGGYDLPGAAVVTGGLFLLVYGFTIAATDGWSSPTTMGMLAGAAVLLVAFVVIEMRVAHPLLPLRVVLDRNRGGAYLASLLVGSAMLGTFLFLTYFFQGTLGYSAHAHRVCLPPLFGRHHPRGGRGQSPAAPVRPPPADGRRVAARFHRAVLVHPAGCRQHLHGPRPAPRDHRELRHGHGLRAHVQHRPHRCRPHRCRGGQRPGQHHPAGGQLARHRSAQHHCRLGGRHLPGAHAHAAGDARAAVVHGYTTAFTVSALILLLAAGAAAGLIQASRQDTAEQESVEPQPALVG